MTENHFIQRKRKIRITETGQEVFVASHEHVIEIQSNLVNGKLLEKQQKVYYHLFT